MLVRYYGKAIDEATASVDTDAAAKASAESNAESANKSSDGGILGKLRSLFGGKKN